MFLEIMFAQDLTRKMLDLIKALGFSVSCIIDLSPLQHFILLLL